MADGLQKLQLTGYQDDGFSKKVSDTFSLPINPKSFTHGYQAVYETDDALGKSAASPTFNKIGEETVTLNEVYIDTTGAIPATKENQNKTVDQLITDLKKQIYTYVGALHAPPYVQLVWGSFIFNCVLTSLNIEYQMFKPDGTPLRAKVDMSFMGFQTPKQEANAADRQSPDVTHIIAVKHGDSLPALCYKVYNNAGYYPDVAHFNQLIDFRNLKVGDRLIFPPLK